MSETGMFSVAAFIIGLFGAAPLQPQLFQIK